MLKRKTKPGSQTHGRDNTEVKKSRTKNEETILIKPLAGTSYADIIKNMKNEVDTQGILIDRINRTSNGNVQLRIKGKETKNRQIFKQLLSAKLEKIAKVDIRTRKQTVMIMDIDETKQADDVLEVLRRELNTTNEELQIKMAEKANKNGLKYAFVTINTEAAKQLIMKKRIGEGWDRWRIRETHIIPRCYNCHKVGHIAKDCKSKQEEETCHKCSKPGHKIKECQDNPWCYLCKIDGHKTETMRCPEYRKLVQTQKKEEKTETDKPK